MTEENINNELDIKLIQLVRINPLLYKKELRSSPYYAQRKKNELWKSVATSLGIETNYCIRRWKNLSNKFQLELRLMNEMNKKTNISNTRKKNLCNWPLFDNMLFLRRHVNLHLQSHRHIESSSQKSEKSVNQISTVDDTLQEAMDDQNCTEKEPDQTMYLNKNTEESSNTMKRIETLLEGLGPSNRTTAEKRIISYLCKCQLNHLNNEGIENINF